VGHHFAPSRPILICLECPTPLGRSRQRVCLQEGLSLKINRLIRQGFLIPGRASGPFWISWTYSYSAEKIATGIISGNLAGPNWGEVQIKLGTLDQTIPLLSQPRYFGGRQWYFRCPKTGRASSTLWLPNGASRFASRHAWARQVAYSSQFQTRHDRALTRAQGIRARLGGPDWAGLDELDPPKPRGMRWATYNRLIAESRRLESVADERLFFLLNQWQRLN